MTFVVFAVDSFNRLQEVEACLEAIKPLRDAATETYRAWQDCVTASFDGLCDEGDYVVDFDEDEFDLDGLLAEVRDAMSELEEQMETAEEILAMMESMEGAST